MILPRYERRLESRSGHQNGHTLVPVPFDLAGSEFDKSSLSPGSRTLLLALLRTGTVRDFPGGGVGIEYGSLLKTAARPDEVGEHVREAAAHLTERRVDLLLVPGMSGYPIGAMYACAAAIPAVLLKKQKPSPDAEYSPGSFSIPSYTGEGDVVMSADLDAVCDIVQSIVTRQIGEQRDAGEVAITLRCAGADDIIDKAVMAHAITESAPVICAAALDDVIARHRAETGDTRLIFPTTEVVAWVTPLMKTYNGPAEHLRRSFGIEPFAGLSIDGVYLNSPAISVEGAGTFAFAAR